jgi:hypothetical protein
MRPGEVEVRREAWLTAAIAATALATFFLGLLPGPLLQLATQAGALVLVP